MESIFPGNKREESDKLKIIIGGNHLNKDNINEYQVNGSGLRTWIWNLERYFGKAYDDHKIVCYEPWDNTENMVDDCDYNKRVKEFQDQFRK